MNVFATTLFCDDIRFEVNDKRTYVGCYDGALGVAEFPAVVSQLCASVTLQLRDFPEADTDVEARIFLPGDTRENPSITSRMIIPGQLKPSARSLDPFDVHPMLKVRQDFVLSPVEFKVAGAIRVRLLYRGEVLRAGSLEVCLMEPESGTDRQIAPSR